VLVDSKDIARGAPNTNLLWIWLMRLHDGCVMGALRPLVAHEQDAKLRFVVNLAANGRLLLGPGCSSPATSLKVQISF
jgi:hypothetical protein